LGQTLNVSPPPYLDMIARNVLRGPMCSHVTILLIHLCPGSQHDDRTVAYFALLIVGVTFIFFVSVLIVVPFFSKFYRVNSYGKIGVL
jgi:hypothetical protein